MHPSFDDRAATPAIPITFVTKSTLDRHRAALARAGPALRARPTPSRRSPGQCLPLPAADGGIAQRAVRPRGRRQRDGATRSGPGSCRACCRLASIASPTRRTTRGSPRWPSRSAAIASAATARRDAPDVRLVPPDGVDIADIVAHGRGGRAGARPHQHAVERHGPGGTGGGRARARRAFRRAASAASSATICSRRIFR